MTETLWELLRNTPKHQSVALQTIFTGQVSQSTIQKKYRGEPQTFWNKDLWTDETKINPQPKWRKGQSVETEGICSWSKTYKFICEARWRKCHGLALHGRFWSGLTHIYWWCNFSQQYDEFRNLQKHSVCQLMEKCVHLSKCINLLGGTSSCSKTMTQNTLPKQQRTSLHRKSGRF